MSSNTMKKTYGQGQRGKSRPGVCDVCGCAVVRVSDKEVEEAMAKHDRKFLNGHLYETLDGPIRLVSVRCLRHAEDFDPRTYGRRDFTWGIV